MSKSYWIVWNNPEKGEGVTFDNYNDAHQTSTGDFQQMAPSIGEEFFNSYGDDAPLEIQKIEL